jgi:NADH-quinone oxidoreductase subunit K
MMISYAQVLGLSAILFLMGMFTVLTRRNLIMILLGLEIMLNAASVAFVGAGLHWHTLDGQAMVIFVMAVAAAEVSVGLALVVCTYRQTGSVNPTFLDEGP